MNLKLILKQILHWLFIVTTIIVCTMFITDGVIRKLNPKNYVERTGKNKTVHDDNKSNDYTILYYFVILIVGIFSLTIWFHCFCRHCMDFIVRVTSNLYTNFRNLIQLLNFRSIIRYLNRLIFLRAPPVNPAVPRDNLQVRFRDNMVALDPRALGQYSSDEEI